MPHLKQLSQLRSLYTQQTTVRTSLYTQPMRLVQAGGQAAHEAVRWIESVNISDCSKPALFMHPVSSAQFVITVQPKMKFVAWLTLLPGAWEQNESGVEFVVTVQADTGQSIQKKFFIHPKVVTKQRGWNPCVVDLHPFAGQTARLTLATQVPSGAATAYGWAVWGEPNLVTPRPTQEVVKTAWEVVQANGVVETLRRTLHLAEVAQHASDPYVLWQMKHALTAEEMGQVADECRLFSYAPTISIVMPVYNVDPKWLRLCVESVRAQYYQKWELCMCDDGSTSQATREAVKSYVDSDPRIKIKFADKNSGIAGATNQALDLATGEYIGLLDNDDELAPEALYEVVKLLQEHKDADMIYSDEDKVEEDGSRSEPFFKPDWSPDYFLSCMYTSHFGVYRRSLVQQVGRFRSAYDKSQDYDLALRVVERSKSIFHIQKVLYHWRKISTSTASSATAKNMTDTPAKRALEDYVKRNHLQAEVLVDPVTSYHRMKYKIQGQPLVSILIPTNGKIAKTEKGEMNLLKNCLESVWKKTTYPNYEVVVAHNGNLTPDTFTWLQEQAKTHRVTILHYQYQEPFNFANKMNFIAKQAKGEHFLILNDDIEVISPDWMTALLEFSQQSEVGVVGAKLYYPDGRIQHAGVIMGIGGGASHVLTGKPKDYLGYFASAKVIKNYSVVTGACAMTKQSLFHEVGGFDEKFRIDYNDVDYCLRLRAKGLRVVYTPYAELFHHESTSLGSRAGKVGQAEEELLRSRWKDVIANDPYYNPHLTLQDTNYQIRL